MWNAVKTMEGLTPSQMELTAKQDSAQRMAHSIPTNFSSRTSVNPIMDLTAFPTNFRRQPQTTLFTDCASGGCLHRTFRSPPTGATFPTRKKVTGEMESRCGVIATTSQRISSPEQVTIRNARVESTCNQTNTRISREEQVSLSPSATRIDIHLTYVLRLTRKTLREAFVMGAGLTLCPATTSQLPKSTNMKECFPIQVFGVAAIPKREK